MLTGIAETELARYLGGHVCAQIGRAEELSDKLLSVACLPDHMAAKIERDSAGYMDTSKVITDPMTLALATHYAVRRFNQVDVTKVVAASVDGIPIATLIAQRFGVDVIVIREEKKGVASFVEGQYDTGAGLLLPLYIPKSTLSRRDSVLVVDGVVHSYRMHAALKKLLIDKAKVRVAGMFALIAVTNEWATLRESYPENLEVILQMPERIVPHLRL
jgi:adenine/guanine phosphoribosyltransferase-like PRPP-binding protein